MLYQTTRDDLTVYTSEHALREIRSPDGGFYIPYRLPVLSAGELRQLHRMSPAECAQKVACRFLRIPDRVFATEGVPLRLGLKRNRIAVAEIFPHPDGSFRGHADDIARSLWPKSDHASPWLSVSIRIGMLAAALMGYSRSDEDGERSPVDIAMIAGDLFGPVSAFVAREIGLPLGDIVCCCNENHGFWDLLHHGQLRTDLLSVRSAVPEADTAVPDGLECLIALCCGREEVCRYLDAARRGRTYAPGAEELDRLRASFCAAVVTGGWMTRGAHVCGDPSVRPATALAAAGLLDHRAGRGCVRPAMVVSE